MSQDISVIKEGWENRTVPLKFQLGEKTLFSLNLKVLVCSRHFTELTPEMACAADMSMLPRGFDGLLIRSVPVEGSLARITSYHHSIRYVLGEYKHYYIDLRGTYDEYLRKFSSKTRSTLNKKRRKFAEHSGGQIKWREFSSDVEIREFYPLARALSERTYQERLLHSGLPADAAFVEEMVALARNGLVRAYLMS